MNENESISLEESIESTDTLATEEEIPSPTEQEITEPHKESISQPEEETDPIASLRAEVDRLRTELEAARTQNEKTAAEVGEFHSLFPTCTLSSIPDSVWDQVKSGIPLSAAYALYEKKCEAAARRAEAVNLQNAKRSAGIAGRDAPAEYFTPDEVRAMSPSDVRRNYTKILESMQGWNR